VYRRQRSVVHSFDDVKASVCQYRINSLKDHMKYSFKCDQYRKYSLCRYKLKAAVPDC